MRIGNLELANQVIMAPMAGITDRAFRILAREQGAALTHTEMVSGRALVEGNRKTTGLLDLGPDEQPVAVQLFGADPGVLARAAEICEQAGADIIDINMGCPVPKIVRSGEGSALMNTSELAARIVAAVRAAVSVPVTAKMRSGWSDTITAPDLARMLEQAGASAVTVHARTRDQRYTGRAHWPVIAAVREAVSIPVIGNGDVFSPDDATAMLEQTGCAGVMIARGALGNPWLIGEVGGALSGSPVSPPSVGQKLDGLRRHIRLIETFKGSRPAALQAKKHASWYARGLPGAAAFRRDAMTSATVTELLCAIDRWEPFVLSRGESSGSNGDTGR